MPVQEKRCEEVYEKKCAINMTEVTVDEEVTSCSRPLVRRCGDRSNSSSNSSGLVRRRRDTLQQHIQSLARVLADTLTPAPAPPPGSRDPLVTGTGTSVAAVTPFPAAGWRGRPRPRGGGGVQDVPRDPLQRGRGLPEGPRQDLRRGRGLQPPGGRRGV